MNPFIAFCLYVASRVFVQYLKSRPEDQSVRASLDFLLGAMRALKQTNPLAESFLSQLAVDLGGSASETELNRYEGLSLDAGQCNVRISLKLKRLHVKLMPSAFKIKKMVPMETTVCSPIVEPRKPSDPEITITGSHESSFSRPLLSTNGSPMDFHNVANFEYTSSHLDLPNRHKLSRKTSNAISPTYQGNMDDSDHPDKTSRYDAMHKMDTENPFSNGGSDHPSSSGHPTPSTTSNKSSSHTSYSPPHTDDPSAGQNPTFHAPAPSPSATAIFDSGNTFTGFSPGSQQFLADVRAPSSNQTYGVLAGWVDQNQPPNMTPGNRDQLASSNLPPGMAPFEEGGWVNMLNDFGWDRSALAGPLLSREGDGHVSRS